MKPILEVSNVSKKFQINHLPGGYLSLRERILTAFTFHNNGAEDFWALDDISFDVMAGESIGIIGRNGAGKSTLLKILSRITPPTRGTIISRGRIASLLEVGTGFHPELTGMENIFFNGSLLGMTKREIRRKFDEIVDFSGTEKFLNTALKHYSSGMQLRLAFSVAAFLEPEILVIDEVLAVGDAEFQKKCLGKMEDVSKSGRTILFVSHNMQALSALCKRGIILDNGKLKMTGEIGKAIETYLQSVFDNETRALKIDPRSTNDPDFEFNSIEITQGQRAVGTEVLNGEPVHVKITYRIKNRLHRFRVFVDVCDHMGSVVFRSFNDEHQTTSSFVEPGRYVSTMTLPANLLAPITYDLRFFFGIHNVRMLQPTDGISYRLNVIQTGAYNSAYHGQYSEGLICPVLEWDTEKE